MAGHLALQPVTIAAIWPKLGQYSLLGTYTVRQDPEMKCVASADGNLHQTGAPTLLNALKRPEPRTDRVQGHIDHDAVLPKACQREA